MGMMFGGGRTPKPPDPPPPPASPPTYASQAAVRPSTNIGRFGALSDTILTGPIGTTVSADIKNKTLLGA
jgi:hypothetical protein